MTVRNSAVENSDIGWSCKSRQTVRLFNSGLDNEILLNSVIVWAFLTFLPVWNSTRKKHKFVNRVEHGRQFACALFSMSEYLLRCQHDSNSTLENPETCNPMTTADNSTIPQLLLQCNFVNFFYISKHFLHCSTSSILLEKILKLWNWPTQWTTADNSTVT